MGQPSKPKNISNNLKKTKKMLHFEFKTPFFKKKKKKKVLHNQRKKKKNIYFGCFEFHWRVSLKYDMFWFFNFILFLYCNLHTYLMSLKTHTLSYVLLLWQQKSMDTWHPTITKNVHHKIHSCRRRKVLFTYHFLLSDFIFLYSSPHFA